MFSKFKAFSNTNNLNAFNKFIAKGFKDTNGKTTSAAGSYLKYGLLGLGIGGLGYVSYQAGKGRDERLRTMLYSNARVPESVSLQRTKDTLTYFASGLCLTSFMTLAIIRSERMMSFMLTTYSRPWLYLMLTIPTFLFTIYGMHKAPTPENRVFKHACWGAFNGVMSFTIAPLVYSAGLALAGEALLITGGAVGGLGYISYISKNDAFLGLNGVLAAGSGVMMACALASFFTQSAAINNIWLYGGLALFLAYVLYDVNQIKIKAERQAQFDPMGESIHIYLDTVNIFIRVLDILNGKRNKK